MKPAPDSAHKVLALLQTPEEPSLFYSPPVEGCPKGGVVSRRGLSAAEIANLLGITEREVRHAIEYLRNCGEPICARPETGYYYAQSPEELSKTLAFLHHRAMTTLTQICRMRKIGLPELLGQLTITGGTTSVSSPINQDGTSAHPSI